MCFPYRGGVGQDQPVQHAAAGCQNAHHGVGTVAVDVAPATQSMAALKGLTQACTQFRRRGGTQNHLHGRIPQAALRHRGGIKCGVVMRTAHNAKTLKAVTQADGDDLGHQRMLGQRLHGL